LCKFLITIVDDEIPLITCPANIFTDTDRGADGGSATFQLPTVRDNTEGVVSVKCDHNSGTSSFPIGVTTITCEAKDAAGNINYCSFIVQVFDVEPPTIFCPADVTVHTERGKNFGIATWDTPRTLDNSKGVVQITTTIQFGSQFPLGSTSVRFDAEDPSRNPQSCTFTGTVLDKEIPAIICPADITTVADLRAWSRGPRPSPRTTPASTSASSPCTSSTPRPARSRPSWTTTPTASCWAPRLSA
jgi:large repetitive protein